MTTNPLDKPHTMLLRTMLNRVEPQKGFIYDDSTLTQEGGRLALEVQVEPRRNSRSACSGCHRKRPGCDRFPPRRFESYRVTASHPPVRVAVTMTTSLGTSFSTTS